MTSTDTAAAPALKEIFNRARLRHIAAEMGAVHAGFDGAQFLALAMDNLDTLSVMERLRRVTLALHATLPADYGSALDLLYQLAPRLDSAFVSMVLPDYVALYGADEFELSMAALAFFTCFGSSEFAVRHFLRRDPVNTLARMEIWSRDENEHVRRLASEGSRPRLPWSFRLEAQIADPAPALAILNNLRSDASPYVRKSVANHLNDIGKDHPDWLCALLESWPLDDVRSAWIAKHALRSLIKKGYPRALAIIGAGARPQLKTIQLAVSPHALQFGDTLLLSATLASAAGASQRLVVDYAIHYVKKNGATSAKVFKWKTLDLAAGESLEISRRQQIRDFTTRIHYPGRHQVDLLVNGIVMDSGVFELRR